VDLVVRVPHGTTILQSGKGGSSVDLVAEFAWGMPKLAMDEPQLFLGRLADIPNVLRPCEILRQGDTKIFH